MKWREKFGPESFVIPIVATVLVLLIIGSVWPGILELQRGTFLVLSFTLVAVIWYTYFTYRLVVRKEEPAVAANIYYVRETKDVRVIVKNLTNRYLKTRVWVQPKVYGKQTDLGPAYSGQSVWHLTPQFSINGHFPLEKPLQQVGKNFETMVAEANDENVKQQLQLSLKVKWEDKDGKGGGYPPHFWYFKFRENSFVYKVGV